jgi:hypothetical protein
MCVEKEDVRNIFNDKFSCHERFMNSMFDSQEKLMNEKFKTNYANTQGDFKALNTRLDTLIAQEKRIDCLEQKMISKKTAYLLGTIVISIVGLFFAFVNIYPIT